ncbi:hypothetical protein JAO71_08495 [Olleya sp. YSTF-M6]|uniref:Uncharacterized protein n=1 Tax=Olleya sediminilitoris TaxID=2795739 RepID=A0ABS1WL42_9FLAO|nr:hypothetical protein [Olleya sediminilitoris]MBL7559840.1 hypothetical protein [Olleya sediminilitoris]
MHRKLLLDAYLKAKEEQGFIKKTHISTFLSDYINENTGEPYGEKILRIKYNKAIKNGDEPIVLKIYAAEALKQYLGTESDIKPSLNTNLEITEKSTPFLVKNKTPIITTAIFILLLFTINIFKVNNEKWMVWQNDHYEESPFIKDMLQSNLLKIYKKESIENFKMIEPNCQTSYFSENGDVKLWYGKNKKKQLNYFTSYGLHPETGKTLKPITVYMIKKHICSSY